MTSRSAGWMFRALAVGVVIVLSVGCGSRDAPAVVVGVDGCTECGMVISDGKQAAGYLRDREFLPFCSAGCLLQSSERMRKRGEPRPGRLFFADYLAGGMHPAESMTFLLTGQLPTVMNWGIVAFSDAAAANRHRRGESDVVTDWHGVERLRGEPDRSVRVVFVGDGMEPEVVGLVKGELVVLEVGGDKESRIRVRGYEELGEIVVPAAPETGAVRLLATRPGDGFPVVRSSDGATLGRIRIAGPHTADEEVR